MLTWNLRKPPSKGFSSADSPEIWYADCPFDLCEYRRFSASDALLSKILKDKSKKQKDEQKRAKEAEKRKLAGVDSDWDEEQAEEEATVKKAKFEESRAEMKRKFQESSGPPIFRQCLFPSEVWLRKWQSLLAG